MNWDALGAIGEIVGAVAVIATLLYLAIQIREARLLTKSTSLQNAVSSFNELNVVMGSDPKTVDLITRGVYDF